MSSSSGKLLWISLTVLVLACAAWLLTRPHVGTRGHADRSDPAAAEAAVRAAQPDLVLSAQSVFVACLDSTASQFVQKYQDVASKPNLQAVNALAATLHNAAVEKDRVLADRLNRQIRDFKARHG